MTVDEIWPDIQKRGLLYAAKTRELWGMLSERDMRMIIALLIGSDVVWRGIVIRLTLSRGELFNTALNKKRDASHSHLSFLKHPSEGRHIQFGSAKVSGDSTVGRGSGPQFSIT